MDHVLKYPMSGQQVTEMTRMLASRGHLDKPTAEFTAAVRAAVREFQARHLDPRGQPLVADGVVGPLTWWALRNSEMPAAQLEARSPAPALPASGGSRLGRAALAVALAEANRGACEVGGNNDGPWVKKYLNGMVDPPENWCAGFVSWCFLQAANPMPFPYSLGARAIRNDFRQRGWLYDPNTVEPAAGDLIFWWRGQPNGWKGHIGLVLRSDAGIVYTIEGNKGAFPAPVGTFSYVLGRIDQLLGFGRVP